MDESRATFLAFARYVTERVNRQLSCSIGDRRGIIPSR